MSGERTALDEHVDRAFAALDDVATHELEAAGKALEKRDDWLERFGRVFTSVAFARERGTERSLRGARYSLTLAIEGMDDAQVEQLERARGRFWKIVCEAVEARLP